MKTNLITTAAAALLIAAALVSTVGYFQHAAHVEATAGCVMVEKGLGLTDRHPLD